MFEDLLKIVQQSGLETVVNNPEVPNEHNDAVVHAAGGSILDTLKGMIANGQADQLTQVAENPNHPAALQMQDNFVATIVQKFGLNAASAKSIASSLIPLVLAQLNSQKGTSGVDSFNLGSIGALLAKTGLDKDQDGDVDLKDITKMLGF